MPLPTPTNVSQPPPVTVIPPRRVRSAFASNANRQDARSSEQVVRQDRRRDRESSAGSFSGERRQFGSSHADLSADGRELAAAIDKYKMTHHRRYITCDEMLVVMRELGYSKS
ncbi:hypothetical protein [Rhodopirellula sp. P2]|uniref:hypothetical protein n=1 Tax=Rhodopirellula sp. P2 TaxID=2127060 RepID=UPI0023677EFA|nr:hypothetical protein [Rhodopirellula sp. P2]WDQ15275.1 hypothetical protein PSR62_16700 [Rhodopirellula sp. P2]